MQLIFVRKIGEEWNGKFIYEFIFAEDIEGVDGEGWDAYPAGGMPEPPDKEYVDRVGRVETDAFNLICVQDSSCNAFWDAVDGVVSLAYEDITDYEEYPEERLKFFYGDDIEGITDSLYAKDIIIEWKYEKKNESN